MEIASCWVVISKNGSNVSKAFITPAELVLLVREFQPVTGKFPVHNLEVFPEIDNKDLAEIEDKGEKEFARLKERQRRSFLNQTSESERLRLRQKYGQPPGSKPGSPYKIDLHYPGESELPETFEKLGTITKQAKANGLTELVIPMPSDDNLPPMPVDEEVPAETATEVKD